MDTEELKKLKQTAEASEVAAVFVNDSPCSFHMLLSQG